MGAVDKKMLLGLKVSLTPRDARLSARKSNAENGNPVSASEQLELRDQDNDRQDADNKWEKQRSVIKQVVTRFGIAVLLIFGGVGAMLYGGLRRVSCFWCWVLAGASMSIGGLGLGVWSGLYDGYAWGWL
jgi:hypothetical protein